MNSEVRTLTRYERIVETWEEVQTIHSHSNVRGVITEEKTETRRRFVLVETQIATVQAFYNGILFPNLAPFSVFFSETGPDRAREQAIAFCLKYRIRPSDPLVLNVQTWTRREEWAETLPEQYRRNFPPDAVIYYRTDTPKIETDRQVVWASNSPTLPTTQALFVEGDRCPTCNYALKYGPSELGQPFVVFCGFCGVEYPVDWTRLK